MDCVSLFRRMQVYEEKKKHFIHAPSASVRKMGGCWCGVPSVGWVLSFGGRPVADGFRPAPDICVFQPIVDGISG